MVGHCGVLSMKTHDCPKTAQNSSYYCWPATIEQCQSGTRNSGNAKARAYVSPWWNPNQIH